MATAPRRTVRGRREPLWGEREWRPFAPLAAPLAPRLHRWSRRRDGAGRTPYSGVMDIPFDAAGRPRLQRPLLTLYAMVLLANTLIAALLTLAAPQIGGFTRNLVFSQCIGLSVISIAVLLRRLPGLARLDTARATLATLLPAAPLGTLTGYAIAYTLLGEPLKLLSIGPGRTAALWATVLGSGFVGYLLWLRQRLAQEAAARARAQQLAVESELRLLRAQIEPHMLFNTLANLRSLIDEDPPLAQDMLDRLITYLRAALAASRSEWTTLGQEFAQLDAYLGLMAMRLGPRLQHALELPDELRAVRIPPMLLQPLVENAIKHGIEPKVGGGRVDVRARRREDGGVEIVIDDTGLGAAAAAADDAAGSSRYGLSHVRERLRSVYGDSATFELVPAQPQGMHASVRIPA
ncbi:MAG: hypothetical protein Fur0019_14150 [Tibeticola sp.]